MGGPYRRRHIPTLPYLDSMTSFIPGIDVNGPSCVSDSSHHYSEFAELSQNTALPRIASLYSSSEYGLIPRSSLQCVQLSEAVSPQIYLHHFNQIQSADSPSNPPETSSLRSTNTLKLINLFQQPRRTKTTNQTPARSAAARGCADRR